MVGQRRVQGDEIRLGKQGIKVSFLNAHFNRAISGQERIKGNNLHPQAKRATSDDGTNVSSANQAKRLARDLNAHETVFRPEPCLGLRIGLRQLTRESKHQGDGMFCRGNRVTEGRVHNDNTLGRRIGDVDIVDANARTANDLEVRCGVQDLLCNLGRRTDGDTVIITNDCCKLIRCLVGDNVNVTAAFSKNLCGVRVHLVGDKYAWLSHVRFRFKYR